MTMALTTCAASSAEDAVKEMEIRYERVSFITVTLLRNIATVRSNGEWLRVSGRTAVRSQSRPRVAHERGGAASGLFPSRIATARRTASERIRRASPVTMAAPSTLARATTFPCSRESKFG